MSGKEKERVMGTADEIIAGLDGNPRTGMACCPAHDDETPSLHVSTGAGGKVLVKCFAGCPQEAVIAALKERGLCGRCREPSLPPGLYYAAGRPLSAASTR
jgi:hypothetical protein